MSKPQWPEDPLNESLTGRAVVFLCTLPTLGALSHLTPFAMLSSSSPPFLSPPVSSCPLIYLFFVAKGSLVLALSEKSYIPACSRSSQAHTPSGSWSPTCLSVPWLSPEARPWASGFGEHHSLCCMEGDSIWGLACFAFAFSPQVLETSVW